MDNWTTPKYEYEGTVKKTIFPKLCVHIKDNNNSPHGKFHRFLFPFSSKFPDLNFAPYVRDTNSEPGSPVIKARASFLLHNKL